MVTAGTLRDIETPAVTANDTLAVLGFAQSFTANKTFDDNVKMLLGTGGAEGGIFSDGNVIRIGDTAGKDVVLGDDVEIMRVGNAGAVYLNDSANTGMTIGLTINQGANDDESLSLKSSDIAHALTGQGETDTYFSIRKSQADGGGVTARSLMEDNTQPVTFRIQSYGGQAEAAHSTGADALIELEAREHDGANAVVATNADGNVLGVFTDTGSGKRAIMFVDEDGDIHVDGSTTLTAFDDVPDALVANAARTGVRAASGMPMTSEAARHLREYKELLEERDVIHWNDDTDGVPFINLKAGLLFAWDGLYQAHLQRQELSDQVGALQERLTTAGILESRE